LGTIVSVSQSRGKVFDGMDNKLSMRNDEGHQCYIKASDIFREFPSRTHYRDKFEERKAARKRKGKRA